MSGKRPLAAIIVSVVFEENRARIDLAAKVQDILARCFLFHLIVQILALSLVS